MKLSVNDTNQFTQESILKDGLDFLTKKIGTQLGAIEDIENLAPKYKDAIIAKVIDCNKHPNADKLSVCKLDDGNKIKDIPRDANNLITVVCGANNVGKNQLVVWLPPNSVVPSTYNKDYFTLSSRDLRGITSYGMIASPEELDLNFSNGGILILEEGTPGQHFSEVYNLDDIVIELENKMFTHRPDCFGVIGVAREISAIMGQKFSSPEWYINDSKVEPTEESLPLSISVTTNNVNRVSAVAMKNISVSDSPIFIKSSLIKAGIKPINSVVDISNYLMLMTAQPIHIYDYDKVAKLSGSSGVVLNARDSVSSEIIKLLNGKELSLSYGAVVIATDEKPIGLGGIMGGSETEVDENTNNIIIEVANFDMYNIRRSSMKYGLFTDAVTRNTKRQSPLQTLVVLKQTVRMLQELCGGIVAGQILDYQSKDVVKNHPIYINSDFINERLGSNLDNQSISELLRLTEFQIAQKEDELIITPPFWRTDINLKEDIVEEIGRLHGFNNLPVSLPTTKTTISKIDDQISTNQLIRNQLAAFGANELLTYNFVNEKLLQSSHQPVNEAIKIANALSPNLEYYRLSLTPNLLEKVHINQKAGYEEFAIFEIGKSHSIKTLDQENLPKEKTSVALVYAANKSMSEHKSGAPFFVAKKYLTVLAEKLGLDLSYREMLDSDTDPVFGPFIHDRSAVVLLGEKIIGVVGEYKPSVIQNFKLPQFCAGFEINIEDLHNYMNSIRYKVRSKFPIVKQDITISYPENTSYQTVEQSLKKSLDTQTTEDLAIDYICSDIYQSNNKINYTFSLKYQNNARTQTVKEINAITEKITENIEKISGGKQI